MYYIFFKIMEVSRHLKLNIKKETRAIFLASSKMQKTNTKLFLLLGALMVTLMCPVTVLLLTCFLQESIRHVSYEVYTSIYSPLGFLLTGFLLTSGFLWTLFWPSENATKTSPQEILNFFPEKIQKFLMTY